MIRVQLEKFEGPLALLLYLIKKEEMDIYDIQIHKITQQYFEYIQVMKQLDLEVAGDFVAMAATLIHIKSKMLLPQYNEQGEVIETEDPRKELVQRLLEYQKFQEAAKQLNRRPLLGRENWARPMKEMSSAGEPEIILEDGGLFSMIAAYRRAMASMKKKVHVVFKKTQSVASRVLELREFLIPGRRLQLVDLIKAAEATKGKVVITFLSTLELAKLGFVSVFQSDVYGPIYLDVKRPVEGEIISQMDDYEAKDLEQTMMEAPAENIEDTMPLMAAAQAEAEGALMSATDEEIMAAEAAMDIENQLGHMQETMNETVMLSEESTIIERVQPMEMTSGETAALVAEMPAEVPVAVEPVAMPSEDAAKLNVTDAIRAARDAAGLFEDDDKEKLIEV